MLVFVACLLTAVAAQPVLYDQRQEGEMNVRADVQNVVFVVAIPQKLPFSVSLLDDFFKDSKQGSSRETAIQDRADIHSMNTFLEPSTPYHVEISGDGFDTPAPDVKAVSGNKEPEVVIAGRRNSNNNVEADLDDLKLLGALEQCGPGRARDAEGVCEDVPEQGVEPAPQAPKINPPKPIEVPAPAVVDILKKSA